MHRVTIPVCGPVPRASRLVVTSPAATCPGVVVAPVARSAAVQEVPGPASACPFARRLVGSCHSAPAPDAPLACRPPAVPAVVAVDTHRPSRTAWSANARPRQPRPGRLPPGLVTARANCPASTPEVRVRAACPTSTGRRMPHAAPRPRSLCGGRAARRTHLQARWSPRFWPWARCCCRRPPLQSRPVRALWPSPNAVGVCGSCPGGCPSSRCLSFTPYHFCPPRPWQLTHFGRDEPVLPLLPVCLSCTFLKNGPFGVPHVRAL